MIGPALSFLKAELDQFVTRRMVGNSLSKIVRLGNVVDQDGKVTPNSLLLTLVNIEEESIGKKPFSYRRDSAGDVSIQPSAIALNLLVLVTATVNSNDAENPTADTYDSALNLLSTAIEFFQANRHFSHADFPTLDAGIEKLLVDQVSLTLQEQQNLWGYIGAKYMPSALFRIRLVRIESQVESLGTPAVSGIELRSSGVES